MSEPAIDDQDLVFAEDDAEPAAADAAKKRPWKVMIVDDDPLIHDITILALDGFTFNGRGLDLIRCYSGADAKQTIAEHPDTALMLLDVVMEDDHAGLDVARYVREDAKNHSVRIVLRTGQPGQAPERRVISEYDINDYKEKTELTANKLYTLMHASLRSYRDIETIEASKRGLEHVIQASANIFELTSLQRFAEGMLEQITALLHIDPGAFFMRGGGVAANANGGQFEVVAGTGKFAGKVGSDVRDLLDEEQANILERVCNMQGNAYADDSFFAYFKGRNDTGNVLHISGVSDIDPIDKDMIELFTRNASIAFENIRLHNDLEATQREIVYLLGEAVETRSRETGNHVKRVAEISKLLALEYGLNPDEAEVIKFASPLHDIGKIGIPDAILNKPGKHTDEEREIMKAHADIGYRMLKDSKRRVLQAGAVIANEHHERWDGAGYPNCKKGEDIHVFGRITAVADVFDALGSDRCYKKAWPMAEVIDYFKSERGKQFDPALVDLLLRNIGKIEKIQEDFQDPA